MLDTYISSRGSAKTIVRKNKKNTANEFKWDANYDGDVANISINTNDNGKRDHYEYNLDNAELANILNVNSVDIPIDKRLEQDFLREKSNGLALNNMVAANLNSPSMDELIEPMILDDTYITSRTVKRSTNAKRSAKEKRSTKAKRSTKKKRSTKAKRSAKEKRSTKKKRSNRTKKNALDFSLF